MVIRNLRDCPDLMTAKETALVMQVTERTVRGWMAKGEVDTLKIGNVNRILKSSIENKIIKGE